MRLLLRPAICLTHEWLYRSRNVDLRFVEVSALSQIFVSLIGWDHATLATRRKLIKRRIASSEISGTNSRTRHIQRGIPAWSTKKVFVCTTLGVSLSSTLQKEVTSLDTYHHHSNQRAECCLPNNLRPACYASLRELNKYVICVLLWLSLQQSYSRPQREEDNFPLLSSYAVSVGNFLLVFGATLTYPSSKVNDYWSMKMR
jgi:hypothetical protein